MRWIEKNIIYFLIIVAMVFRFKIPSFRTGYEFLFLHFATSVFSYHLYRKGHFEAAVFLLLCIISSFYPLASVRSFQSLRVVFIGVGLYFLLSELDLDLEKMMNALFCGCLVHISFLVLKHYNIEPYLIYGMVTNSEGIGLTANPNEATAMLTLCAPAFFRPIFIYFSPLLLIGYMITGSFSGLVAIAAFLIVFLMYRKQWVCIVIAVLLLVYAYFTAENNPGTHRLQIWRDSIKAYFKDRSIFGYGLGHFQYVSKNLLIGGGTVETVARRAHNTFLQVWFEMRFPVIPIIISFIYRKIKAIVTVQHAYAAAGIIVCCNVNSAFRINGINALIMILWIATIKRDRAA